MRIGFAGTPAIAAEVLKNLLNYDVKIDVVITKPDTVRGRGKKIHSSAVGELADEKNIPVLKPIMLDSDFQTELETFKLDVILVVAYGKLIPEKLLATPRHGWFNLHFSVLPKYRGATPVQTAILNGDTETGVSLFRIDKGLDTGDLLSTERILISEDDDAKSVFSKLVSVGSNIIVRTIRDFNMSIIDLKPQDSTGASYTTKLSDEIFWIDWNKNSKQIQNQIRALSADGAAYTHYFGNRLKIHRAREVGTRIAQLGKVVRYNKTILVGTGSGDLELIQVQPEGRGPMSAESWFNGLREENPGFN